MISGGSTILKSRSAVREKGAYKSSSEEVGVVIRESRNRMANGSKLSRRSLERDGSCALVMIVGDGSSRDFVSSKLLHAMVAK